MPAVLVRQNTIMQNSHIFPKQWQEPLSVLIAPVHGGMARLSWRGWVVS